MGDTGRTAGTDLGDLENDADGIRGEMDDLLDNDDKGGKGGEGGQGKSGKGAEGDVDDLDTGGEGGEGGEGDEGGEGGEGGEGEGGEGKGEGEDTDEDEDLEEEIEGEFRESAEPPLLRDLQKTYPDIFKKHKELRGVLFRENNFTQIFPDPRDAAAAAQNLEDYREFEHELLAGDTLKTLTAIKATSVDGYKRFIGNILPVLQEHDSAVYAEVTMPIISGLLGRARAIGESRGDQNLVHSVKHIAALIWPELKGNVPEIKKSVPVVDERLLERERQQQDREAKFEMRIRKEFVGGVKTIGEKLLRRKIERGLDPNNALTSFLKASIVDKTMKDIQDLLDEDTRFGRSMEALLVRAQRAGYSGEFKTRMIGTFLGRATQLIGPTRKRYLQQALGKGSGGGTPAMRRQVGEAGAPGRSTTSIKAAEIDWEQSSDLDIISGKATKRRR